METSNNQGDSVVLEEEIDPNYEPTEDEVIEYAKWLGMDIDKERDLFWIAREGLKAPLPEHWKPCKTKDTNEIYYFNFQSGESTWDHPCDEFYRKLYDEHKKKKFTATGKSISGNTEEKKKKEKEDVAELLGKNKKKKTIKNPIKLEEMSSIKSNLDKKPLPGIPNKLSSDHGDSDFPSSLKPTPLSGSFSAQKKSEIMHNPSLLFSTTLNTVSHASLPSQSTVGTSQSIPLSPDAEGDEESKEMEILRQSNDKAKRRLKELKNDQQRKEEYDDTVLKEENELEKKIERKRKEWRKEYEELAREHDRKMLLEEKKIKEKEDEELRFLKEEIKQRIARQGDELEEDYQNKIQKMKTDYQDKLSILGQSHEKKLNEKKLQYQRKIEEVEADAKEDLKVARTKLMGRESEEEAKEFSKKGISEWEKQLDESEKELNAVRSKLLVIQKEFQEKEEECMDKTDKLKNALRVRDEFKDQCEKLQKKIDDITSTAQVSNGKKDDLFTNNENEMKRMEQKMQSMEKKMSDTQENLKLKDNELEKLRSKMQNKEEKFKEIEMALATTQNDCKKAIIQVQQLKDELESKTVQMNNIVKEKEEMKNTIGNLTLERKEKSALLDKYEEANRKLKEESKKKDGNIQSLNDGKQSDFDSISFKINNMKSIEEDIEIKDKIHQLTEENKALCGEKEAYETRIEALNKAIRKYIENQRMIEKEKNLVDEKNQSLKKDYELKIHDKDDELKEMLILNRKKEETILLLKKELLETQESISPIVESNYLATSSIKETLEKEYEIKFDELKGTLKKQKVKTEEVEKENLLLNDQKELLEKEKHELQQKIEKFQDLAIKERKENLHEKEVMEEELCQFKKKLSLIELKSNRYEKELEMTKGICEELKEEIKVKENDCFVHQKEKMDSERKINSKTKEITEIEDLFAKEKKRYKDLASEHEIKMKHLQQNVLEIKGENTQLQEAIVIYEKEKEKNMKTIEQLQQKHEMSLKERNDALLTQSREIILNSENANNPNKEKEESAIEFSSLIEPLQHTLDSSLLSFQLKNIQESKDVLNRRLMEMSVLLEDVTQKKNFLEIRCRNQSKEIESLHIDLKVFQAAATANNVHAIDSLSEMERLEYDQKRKIIQQKYKEMIHDFERREEDLYKRKKAHARCAWERKIEEMLEHLEDNYREKAEGETQIHANKLEQLRESYIKEIEQIRRTRSHEIKTEMIGVTEANEKKIDEFDLKFDKEDKELKKRFTKLKKITGEDKYSLNSEYENEHGFETEENNRYTNETEQENTDYWKERIDYEKQLLEKATSTLNEQKKNLFFQQKHLNKEKETWRKQWKNDKNSKIFHRIRKLLDERTCSINAMIHQLRESKSWILKRRGKIEQMEKARKKIIKSQDPVEDQISIVESDDSNGYREGENDIGLKKLEQLDEELVSEASEISLEVDSLMDKQPFHIPAYQYSCPPIPYMSPYMSIMAPIQAPYYSSYPNLWSSWNSQRVRQDHIYQKEILSWVKGRQRVQIAAKNHATWLSGLYKETQAYAEIMQRKYQQNHLTNNLNASLQALLDPQSIKNDYEDKGNNGPEAQP